MILVSSNIDEGVVTRLDPVREGHGMMNEDGIRFGIPLTWMNPLTDDSSRPVSS